MSISPLPPPKPPGPPPPPPPPEGIPIDEQIPSPFGKAVAAGCREIERNQTIWRGNTFTKITDGSLKSDITEIEEEIKRNHG